MVEIKCCPSTLAEGYDTYSPQAVKRLFDGKRVSPFLDFNINELSRRMLLSEQCSAYQYLAYKRNSQG
jgi:hypothetical protein